MTAKFVPGEVERHERGTTQEVRGDQDQPPIDAVDVDARDRREQHGWDEEGQDQQADRGVRAGRVDDDDGQSEQDHVAADLGRHLRQPEAQEAAVLEDREGVPLVVWLAGRDRLGHADGPSEGRRATSRSRGGHRRIAARHEPGQPTFEDAALEQHVAPAGLAAQADVGTEAIDEPGAPATRVGASELDDVAEEQREDGLVWHRRVRLSKARLTVRRDECCGSSRAAPADRPA